jgi:hypothetical protein
MFKDRLAYAIARGEEVEDACVNKYDDRVKRVNGRGDNGLDGVEVVWPDNADIDSSRIRGNI